ncbi:DUF3903 domain-containing protein [Microbacteriaceae bacterium 4G12]
MEGEYNVVSLYSVAYVFQQGPRQTKYMVTIAASSEEYAVQKVQAELERRFGPASILEVSIVFTPENGPVVLSVL